jgi:transketolase
VWIFTHDSIAVGEDGPTHQPVEHLPALRAIPGLTVIRPADANETVAAWRAAIETTNGPVCLILTRQDVPVLPPELVSDGVARGGYVLRDPVALPVAVVLVATGSEVSTALSASDLLEEAGVGARVVSMPSWELFDAQDDEYRTSVLPAGVQAVSIEAGVAQGWHRFVGSTVAVDRFGASAPGGEVLHRLGIAPDQVVAAAQAAIPRRGGHS